MGCNKQPEVAHPMSTKRSKRRWKVGDCYAIRLQNKEYAYACLLTFPLVAFFDLLTDTLLDAPTTVTRRVLFKLWIERAAINNGNWIRVDAIVPSAALLRSSRLWRTDNLTGEL